MKERIADILRNLNNKYMEEVQKDLDAGKFNQICSNETTFKEYLQAFNNKIIKDCEERMIEDWYGDKHDQKIKEDFLKKILPETIIDEDLVCFQTGHQCCILQIKSNASNEGIKL